MHPLLKFLNSMPGWFIVSVKAQGVKRHRSNTERGPGSAKRQKLTTPPDDMDLDTGKFAAQSVYQHI